MAAEPSMQIIPLPPIQWPDQVPLCNYQETQIDVSITSKQLLIRLRNETVSDAKSQPSSFRISFRNVRLKL